MAFGLKMKGIGKWLMLAAFIGIVSNFIVPRIPLAGFSLAIGLIVGSMFVGRFLPKGLPIAPAMAVVGGMLLFGQLFSQLGAGRLNAGSAQAITYRQRTDPVTASFL